DIQQPEELTTKKLLNHSLENKAVTNNLPTTRYKKENTEDKAEEQDLTLSSERRFNKDSKNEKDDAHINDNRIKNKTTIQQKKNNKKKNKENKEEEQELTLSSERHFNKDSKNEKVDAHINDTRINNETTIQQTQNDQPKQVVSPIQQHVEGKVEDTPLEPDVPEYLLNNLNNESMIDEDWLIEQ